MVSAIPVLELAYVGENVSFDVWLGAEYRDGAIRWLFGSIEELQCELPEPEKAQVGEQQP